MSDRCQKRGVSAFALVVTASLSACLGNEQGSRTAHSRLNEPALSPMIVVRGLEEPLVRTRVTRPEEDRAVHQAANEFRELSSSPRDDQTELLKPFEEFIVTHPHSGWSAAVMTNLGLAYYHNGYFTRAFDALNKAWHEGRDAKEPAAKALVDRAVGELARMHARVGHADALEALFGEIQDRPITGSATELITGAQEGAWEMRNNPGDAFLCGPKALGNTLRALGASPEAVALTDAARSGPRGFTLKQVAALADASGLPHRLIYRAPGQPIPVPSIIHWKVDHYASIVSEEAGRYHIKDPTFGPDLVVSRAAIDAEASGYFLLPLGGREDPRWREATTDEAQAIRGMGYITSSQQGALTTDDVKINNGCGDGIGMCVANAHAMLVSLNLNDTPVGYAPQKGAPVFVRLTYNQRDAHQPANFSYFNVGRKWTLNMLSFVQDDPAHPGQSVSRYVPSGGDIDYPASGYNTSTGYFSAEKQTGTTLQRYPSAGTVSAYLVRTPDGSLLQYSTPDGAATYPRRMFLTFVTDPTQNVLQFFYDSSLRLTSIRDAAGRSTTFSYQLANKPLVITKITDPFGRYATLQYDGSYRLWKITDVLGITSTFGYDANGLVNSLTTPYGTSEFSYGSCGEPPSNNSAWSRWLEIRDPTAAHWPERLEFYMPGQGSPSPVPATDPVLTVPSGMNIGLTNDFMQYRNSFHWSRNNYGAYGFGNDPCSITGKDYTKAKRWHWLHNASNQTSPILESVKEVSENRVWYNYQGQPDSLHEGVNGFPTAIGRVLDNGTSQVYKATYNSIGKPLTVTDPLGRLTRSTYAANNNDLTKVEQCKSQCAAGQTPSWSTIASYTYNSKHEPLTMTDAAKKLWQYAYNSAGQLTNITDPLSHVTTYNYTNGQLTSAVNANNATAFTLSYLANCETSNPNHVNCALPKTQTDSEGYAVSYTRDALDRVTTITYPDGTTDQYQYTFLDLGAHIDRDGRYTQYSHDANRRLHSISDPLNHVTMFNYHPDGLLESIWGPNGSFVNWNIDAQGRPAWKSYSSGDTVYYGYEASTSRLRTLTDSLGQVKTFTYNKDNTVASITYTGTVNPTANVSFSYDPYFPRRIGMTDAFGTTSWTYVPVGILGALSLQAESGPIANSSLSYTYDELGRLSSRTVANTPPETWHYDAVGRITDHGTEIGVFTYGYVGQTSALSNRALAGSSTERVWGYESNLHDRRLFSIFSRTNGTFDGSIRSYTLDTADHYHVRSISVVGGDLGGHGQMPDEHLCYSYDEADRLTGVSKTDPGTSCTGAPNLYSYVYDAAGNMTTFTDASGTVTHPTYNNSKNQILTNGGQTFAYDAAGNVTSDGDRAFKWDAENRLIEVDSSSDVSKSATYQYDGLGRRRKMYNLGQDEARTFTWCGSKLCYLESDAGWRSRIYEEGISGGGDPSNYILATNDHLGNVTGMYIAMGYNLQGSADYAPYGEVRNGVPSDAAIVYGRLYDDYYTGLKYSNTRVYDPKLGRWLSRDPIGEAGGANLYAYVEGDPINRIDPSGLDWTDDTANFLDDWGVDDAAAGFGDTLSFGGTAALRHFSGSGNSVDMCSGAYLGGEITGHVWQAIMLREGVQKGGWMNSNRYFRIGWSRKGGTRVFRIAGKLLGGSKFDIFGGGPL